MELVYKFKSNLITVMCALCTILLINLLYKLRVKLPWRVNCWFCNCNFWLRFTERNSWNCPKCEQYNGFTKDGDYNKPLLYINEKNAPTSRVFQTISPRNGLCKMCNINQQLKVTQLANFVPMNETKFDEEIESYRMLLEKAYKLCSSCKKIVQIKLHKEKEILLGSKVFDSRLTGKNGNKKNKKYFSVKHIINNSSILISTMLLILVLFECYKNSFKYKGWLSTMISLKSIFCGISERLISIVKMKILTTFPNGELYYNNFVLNYSSYSLSYEFDFKNHDIDYLNELTQNLLGCFMCSIQVMGHYWNIYPFKYSVALDLMWTAYLTTTIIHHYLAVTPIFLSLTKVFITGLLLFVYTKMRSKNTKINLYEEKNNSNISIQSLSDNNDSMAMDTDDDVSLSKFGFHNFTDSSSDSISNTVNNMINQSGRCFTPRVSEVKWNSIKGESVWSKPKLNSTFRANSSLSKSPSCVSDTAENALFNTYQKSVKEDSDSDLDESISALCIGSPNKNKQRSKSIFSVRKFTTTPNFLAPLPLHGGRPLISPSKLSTSWVAGGYWGSDNEFQVYSADGSRSSSQSSGFESQTSSLNHRNIFSQPPSREQSVCKEIDPSPLLDRFQNCNVNKNHNFNYQNAQCHLNSPIYPKMQYNSHVYLPQPIYAKHNMGAPNVFTNQQYAQLRNNQFLRTPRGSGLFRLPQVDEYSTR